MATNKKKSKTQTEKQTKKSTFFIIELHPIKEGELTQRATVTAQYDKTGVNNSQNIAGIKDLAHLIFDTNQQLEQRLQNPIKIDETKLEPVGIDTTSLPEPVQRLIQESAKAKPNQESIKKLLIEISGTNSDDNDNSNTVKATKETSATKEATEITDTPEESAETTEITDAPEESPGDNNYPSAYWFADTAGNQLKLKDFAGKVSNDLYAGFELNENLEFSTLSTLEAAAQEFANATNNPIHVWRSNRHYRNIEPTTTPKQATMPPIPEDTEYPAPYVLLNDKGNRLLDDTTYPTKGAAARGANNIATNDAITVHIAAQNGKVYKTYQVLDSSDDDESVELKIVDQPNLQFPVITNNPDNTIENTEAITGTSANESDATTSVTTSESQSSKQPSLFDDEF